MALSGSVNSGGSVGGSYIRIEWSASQNIGANTSTVTANLFLVLQGGTSISATENGNININGNQSNFSRGTTNRGPNGTHLLHTHTVVVGHENDGTKSFSISASFTSGWVTFGTLNTSGSWALDTIPRYAVITGYTRTGITDVAFTTNVTTDVTCDELQYSLNGAGWVTSGSGTFTSRSFTLSNLRSDFTHTIKVRVKRQSSQLWTESSTQNVVTLSQNNFMDIFEI